MSTITLPETIAKTGELVAVPRDAYEDFLAWQKRVKSVRTFKPTAAEKKALARARKNLARGDYLTLTELRHELGFTSR